MSTTLYVFSTTGNCLTTARKLARQLDDCSIISVSSVKNCNKIMTDADSVGFVFPIYYGNMPYPVREMISKMVFRADTYIFMVTTCRGHVGKAPQRMDQLLRTRGQKLSLAAGIKMPGNSFLNELSVDQEYLEKQDENIAGILGPIRSREVRDYTAEELLPMTPVDYPNNFRGITADDHCIGCGTCTKVCPMNNITIENGRAVIGDNCSTCLACFHWCPMEAIYMSKAEEIARRRKYHHPDISQEDIVAMMHSGM